MSDGLTVGAVAVVGGVFVGSVVVYTVSRCKKTSLTTCLKKKTSAVAKKTSQVTADAKQGFLDGFTRAYHGDKAKKTPATAT